MEQFPKPGEHPVTVPGAAPGDLSAALQVPRESKRLINPVERISEVLFGLIMALTFTCTISIIDADREDVRSMLVGAIGCNIAWGIVDAIMFLLGELSSRGHGARILRYIKTAGAGDSHARAHIADALPPVLADVLDSGDLEMMRKKLQQLPASKMKPRLTWVDIKIAFGIFLLVFISTFPVALPFMFIQSVNVALRVSNAVAIVLMFIAGWKLATYGGYNRWLMASVMAVLGVALVLMTIALGG